MIVVNHGGELTLDGVSTITYASDAAIAMTSENDINDSEPAVLSVVNGSFVRGTRFGIMGYAGEGRSNTKITVDTDLSVLAYSEPTDAGIYHPQNGIYVISVSDKAGNITQYTVTMKKIDVMNY